MTRSSSSGGVLIAGGGLIGLSCAAALIERGARVTLFSDRRPGEASPAAAGMLAPSVERARGPAAQFAFAARGRYPGWLAALEEATGVRVPLLRNGILELAISERDAERRRSEVLAPSVWLDARALGELEPALSRASGAIFHPDDGAVDNVALVDALEARVESDRRARVVRRAVIEISVRDRRPWLRAADGTRHEGDVLVLATGAWAAEIAGAPRSLPVSPLRGQMISLSTAPVSRVTYGRAGYIVPRAGGTIAGTTMEPVGFEVGTTADGIAEILRAATEICPSLATAAPRGAWSGLRPVTPDLLPIIGPDPDVPTLLYACGHSRNGILLAPLTGDCIAALATGGAPAHELGAFSIERFRGAAEC
ncbi:MAG: glycine oxidase ThiO [Gemmatimonadota bacterium]|nr:glycine oxidase ThiO [Gemmatimonadota bacterium]